MSKAFYIFCSKKTEKGSDLGLPRHSKKVLLCFLQEWGKVGQFVRAPVASTLKRATMGCAKKTRDTAAMKFRDRI
jgi:hypothetical protein